MDRMICIAGPTASGKTELAVALALALEGEVVSCDSMQVYRHMNIGTAKPTLEERRGVPHHMLDVACLLYTSCEIGKAITALLEAQPG